MPTMPRMAGENQLGPGRLQGLGDEPGETRLSPTPVTRATLPERFKGIISVPVVGKESRGYLAN